MEKQYFRFIALLWTVAFVIEILLDVAIWVTAERLAYTWFMTPLCFMLAAYYWIKYFRRVA